MRRRQILVYDGFHSCPYLPGRVARLPLYRQIGDIDGDEADRRFALGERRVGQSLYKTTCPTCDECKTIRVLCDEFVLSKSQRRVVARWAERGRVEVGPPAVDDERLRLYDRHKKERGLTDPDDEPMIAVAYRGWLVDTCFETIEMRYYYDERLVGVGIVDLGRTGASSAYFYFDPSPEISRLSPGVFSTLKEIELCQQTGRKHLYLGLYVGDCAHLNYKAGYRPHERNVNGVWMRFDRGGDV